MEPKGDTKTSPTQSPRHQSVVTALHHAVGFVTHYYICIKGSLHSNDCSAFGLVDEDIKALAVKFPGSGVEVVNGVSIKANIIVCINMLSQLGYKVASSTGENEITWTMQREL